MAGALLSEKQVFQFDVSFISDDILEFIAVNILQIAPLTEMTTRQTA